MKLVSLLALGLVFVFLTRNQSQTLVMEAIDFFKPQVLTEGVVGQPQLINPLYADLNPVDKLLSRLFYRGLIRFNEAGLPQGDLAERWEVSEDKKTYTFFLKDNIYFSDGQKLTAADVVFTYQLTQRPEYQGPKTGFFKDVLVAAPNASTVSFTLKEPLSSFLESLKMGILPKHLWQNLTIEQILQSEQNLLPVGTGPFHLTKNDLFVDSRGNRIASLTLSLNQGQLKNLVFRFYPDDVSLLTAFKLGEVDSLLLENGELASELTDWPHLKKVKREVQERQFLLLFNNNPPSENGTLVGRLLENRSFRRALTKIAVRTLGVDATRLGPIPPASWAFQPATDSRDQSSREEIEKLLNALGDLRQTEVTLSFPSDDQFLHLARLVSQAALEFGLRLKLIPLETEAFRKKALGEHDFQILLLARTVSPDPDQYVYWHSSQNNLPGLNLSAFSDRRVDKALEEGRTEFAVERRRQVYADFQERLSKQLPAIFLMYPEVAYFFPASLHAEFPGVWWEEADRFREITKWGFE